MDKVTQADLDRLADSITSQAWALGLIDADVYAVRPSGSKTYGNAYRLHFTGGEYGTGHANALHLSGDAFLGWTKAEAYTVLRAVWDTLGAVKWARESVRA